MGLCGSFVKSEHVCWLKGEGYISKSNPNPISGAINATLAVMRRAAANSTSKLDEFSVDDDWDQVCSGAAPQRTAASSRRVERARQEVALGEDERADEGGTPARHRFLSVVDRSGHDNFAPAPDTFVAAAERGVPQPQCPGAESRRA